MHQLELDNDERESFDRAMAIFRTMDHEDQQAMIEHAVATSIGYANRREDKLLVEWAKGLLATIRANDSKSYRAAVEESARPKRPFKRMSVSAVLDGIRH